MNIEQQQTIRNKTSALVVDWANSQKPPFTGESAEGFAEAITAAHLVADEGRITLHRWIDAARRTGVSWADIGNVLGISKQAAQQRFKSSDGSEEQSSNEGEEIVRFGATAFNEMSILRAEGKKGNELVRTGALMLVFRPTCREWEYRRKIGNDSLTPAMRDAGWTYVSSWIPFHYFKRPMPAD